MVGANIFITGATGFIGNHLAARLVEKNKVFALVRPESIEKAVGLKKQGIEIIEGDLLDSDTYSKKLNNMDYVFHLAALFKLDAPKEELYSCNALGTKRLLGACRDKNIKKIIHFSTAYLAGIKEKELITEDEPYPKRYKNWYEWSKAEGEKIALQFYKEYSLPITIIRPVIVYGRGSFYGFYAALNLISKKKLFMLPGNGRNKVHLVHVDDVVDAAIHLAQIENNAREIYHICDDKPYTCNELIQILCKELSVKPPFGHLPKFLARALMRLPFSKPLFGGISSQLLDYFLYHQSYNNKKLKDSHYLLKYPTFIQDLKSVVDWYRDHHYL